MTPWICSSVAPSCITTTIAQRLLPLKTIVTIDNGDRRKLQSISGENQDDTARRHRFIPAIARNHSLRLLVSGRLMDALSALTVSTSHVHSVPFEGASLIDDALEKPADCRIVQRTAVGLHHISQDFRLPLGLPGGQVHLRTRSTSGFSAAEIASRSPVTPVREIR